MTRCFPTAFSVGFYDFDGVFFSIGDNSGFEPNYPECACGVDHYVVRWGSKRSNGSRFRETIVSREEAGYIADRFRRQRMFHLKDPSHDTSYMWSYIWSYNPAYTYRKPRHWGDRVYVAW